MPFKYQLTVIIVIISATVAMSTSLEEKLQKIVNWNREDFNKPEIHITYPTLNMCNCYIIFDTPENTEKEVDKFHLCLSEMNLPSPWKVSVG
jgi:hypothetical protein